MRSPAFRATAARYRVAQILLAAILSATTSTQSPAMTQAIPASQGNGTDAASGNGTDMPAQSPSPLGTRIGRQTSQSPAPIGQVRRPVSKPAATLPTQVLVDADAPPLDTSK